MNNKKKNHQEIFKQISQKENELNSKMYDSIIEVSYQMILFLKEILSSLKDEVLRNDFRDVKEEIAFFKRNKTQNTRTVNLL
ncbi:hypothetical protein [Tenacibaculum piscium]|uniref:hypothetical protein n=1 Tax=Tenacibaculum piscium TaxID=1458515 RepID=UPI001F404DAD|nr:hypothetical protein [Tenacibaculum piscium]